MYKKNFKKFPWDVALAIVVGIFMSVLLIVPAFGSDSFTTEQNQPSVEEPVIEEKQPEPVAEQEEPQSETAEIDYVGTEEVRLYEELSPERKSVITRYAAQTGVEESLVMAICYHESRFLPTVTHENTNGTTDWGVAQCNDTTFDVLHNYIGIEDMSELLDFETGVRACCALLQYYKNLRLEESTDILLAYQQGYGGYQAVKSGEAEPWAAYEETIACMNIYMAYLADNN